MAIGEDQRTYRWEPEVPMRGDPEKDGTVSTIKPGRECSQEGRGGTMANTKETYQKDPL